MTAARRMNARDDIAGERTNLLHSFAISHIMLLMEKRKICVAIKANPSHGFLVPDKVLK